MLSDTITRAASGAAPARRIATLFAGGVELGHAYTLIGWAAVNHAVLEQNLDYLLWQLEVCKVAARRPADDWQARARQMRTEAKWSPLAKRVARVEELLAHSRIAARILKMPDGASYLKEWRELGRRTIELSNQRNVVIHSAVAWSPLTSTVHRTSAGFFDGHPLQIDLKRDQQLVNDLGEHSVQIGVFSTRLGQALPFVAADTITTFVATAPIEAFRSTPS